MADARNALLILAAERTGSYTTPDQGWLMLAYEPPPAALVDAARLLEETLNTSCIKLRVIVRDDDRYGSTRRWLQVFLPKDVPTLAMYRSLRCMQPTIPSKFGGYDVEVVPYNRQPIPSTRSGAVASPPLTLVRIAKEKIRTLIKNWPGGRPNWFRGVGIDAQGVRLLTRDVQDVPSWILLPIEVQGVNIPVHVDVVGDAYLQGAGVGEIDIHGTFGFTGTTPRERAARSKLIDIVTGMVGDRGAVKQVQFESIPPHGFAPVMGFAVYVDPLMTVVRPIPREIDGYKVIIRLIGTPIEEFAESVGNHTVVYRRNPEDPSWFQGYGVDSEAERASFPAPGACGDGSGNWLPMTGKDGQFRPVCPSDPDWPLAVAANAQRGSGVGYPVTPSITAEDARGAQELLRMMRARGTCQGSAFQGILQYIAALPQRGSSQAAVGQATQMPQATTSFPMLPVARTAGPFALMDPSPGPHQAPFDLLPYKWIVVRRVSGGGSGLSQPLRNGTQVMVTVVRPTKDRVPLAQRRDTVEALVRITGRANYGGRQGLVAVISGPSRGQGPQPGDRVWVG